jgi:hypothetical protein
VGGGRKRKSVIGVSWFSGGLVGWFVGWFGLVGLIGWLAPTCSGKNWFEALLLLSLWLSPHNSAPHLFWEELF